MEPISLELFNFGAHRHYLLDYKPGITGVIGENGKGKSTLVDPAQFFSITGQTPNRFKKDSLLHWRAETGKTVFKFTHDSSTYTLTRNLHNTKAHLKIEQIGVPTRTVSILSDINDIMLGILGMSFDIFRETCFASQGSFCNVVNMRHSERTTYFQKITGLKQAEDLRELLQKTINDMPIRPYLAKEVKEAEDKLTEVSEEYRKICMQLRRISTTRRGMEIDYANAQRIQSLPSSSDHNLEVQAKQVDISNVVELLSRYDLGELSEVSFNLKEALLTPEEIQAASNYSKYTEACAKLEKHLEGLPKDIKDVDTSRQLLEDALGERGRLLLRKTLAPGEPCPTCGKEVEIGCSVDVLDDVVAKLATDIIRYRKDLAAAETLGHLERQKAKLECPYVDLDVFKRKEEAYRNYVQDQEQRNKDLAEKHALEIRLAGLKTELDILEKTETVEDYEKRLAIKIVEECGVLDNKIDGLKQTRAGLLATRQERERRCFILKKETERARCFERIKNKYSAARDILHRDKLPTMVMSRVIYCLNEQIEFYLTKFNTNFTAYLSEDFDFRCDFLDSGDANKPAFTSLSGGQKVALSLAFRFALADVLGSSVPILVLDEPTIHLDAANIEAMCDVFKEVRAFAENNVYIFIATHEDELQKAFTRTLVV